jgi:hypothetical protein
MTYTFSGSTVSEALFISASIEGLVLRVTKRIIGSCPTTAQLHWEFVAVLLISGAVND